jgi:ATP-binding cassette subfamily B protein
MIAALAVLISTINPIIAIFPVIGFFFNIITRFRITKLEYNFDIEQKKIMRKADYSKRVFYQPEYAKELKLSRIDEPLRRQMEEAIDQVSKEAKKIGVKIAILSLINWIIVFTFLSYFCVPMYLGYLAIVKRSVTLGDVTAMNNATNGVRNRLDALNYALVDFQRVGQYAQRFRRFIEYEIKIERQVGSVKLPKEKDRLEIKNMSFRYEGSQYDTLKNINMTVHPGERVAIVGENGAGKTTFVKLLMRLYDVSEGSIVYGGHDIREYTTKEYRDIFGAVFQDFQIYGTTLAENVAMESVTETESERIKGALALADFSKKLAKLKNGIQTEMTREFADDGTMLSGGEAQKVAISRMFAKVSKLSIAILDEPSSALDPLAEYTLNKNMMENAKDASIIFISHRLSTTKDADRIYMFENGEIIEQGTHKELMELNGKYAVMFERQAHYYQEEIA